MLLSSVFAVEIASLATEMKEMMSANEFAASHFQLLRRRESRLLFKETRKREEGMSG